MIADTQINTTSNISQFDPSITTLNDGGFVVSWVSDAQDGSSYGIYAQQFNENGVAQGNEFRVNTYTDSSQWQPAITALSNGSFVVSWQSNGQNGGGSGIYAQRFNANGVAQGGEFRVNTYTILNQYSPVITALNDGGFVVSWESDGQDGGGSGIYAQRYDGNGVAQGSEFRVNTYTINYQNNPAITALNNGGFVVSWQSYNQDGSGSGIYARRFNENGVTQGSEFRVNTYTDSSQWQPAITALNDGGFVVSWASDNQDGDDSGVYAQRYNANGVAQGSEFRVNTYTIYYQDNPAITALADGGFVVSWTSGYLQDGSGQGVYAQRYDENGVAQGTEFRVNTYTDDDQQQPAITALHDGGFVVSWASYFQDDFDGGIFAHRYDAAGNEIGWTAADRLFNWAESIFPDLLPNHPESIELSVYHVRIYENGNVLGERNDNIYFYDGHSVILVGTVNDYLPDAIAAGF